MSALAIGWFSLVVVSIGVSYLITLWSVSKSHDHIDYWANKKFTTNADILANNEGIYKRIESLEKLVADNAAPYKFGILDEVEPSPAFERGVVWAPMFGFYGYPNGKIVDRRHEYKDGKRKNEYKILTTTNGLFGKSECKWFDEYNIQLKKPEPPAKIKPVARKRTVTRKRK